MAQWHDLDCRYAHASAGAFDNVTFERLVAGTCRCSSTQAEFVNGNRRVEALLRLRPRGRRGWAECERICLALCGRAATSRFNVRVPWCPLDRVLRKGALMGLLPVPTRLCGCWRGPRGLNKLGGKALFSTSSMRTREVCAKLIFLFCTRTPNLCEPEFLGVSCARDVRGPTGRGRPTCWRSELADGR